jgi:hypothetical protein
MGDESRTSLVFDFHCEMGDIRSIDTTAISYKIKSSLDLESVVNHVADIVSQAGSVECSRKDFGRSYCWFGD